jgi:hypothetical protein
MLSLADGQLGDSVLPPNIVASMIDNIERGDIRPSFASSSSNQPMSMEVEQEAPKRSPETDVEPKGKRGRPRKTQPELMNVDTDQKRKTEDDSPNKRQSKSSRKKEKEEAKQTRNYIQDVFEDKPEETTKPAGSSKDIPIKQTIGKKAKHNIAPSAIGIQALREAFGEANNRKTISKEEFRHYKAVYEEWEFTAYKEKRSKMTKKQREEPENKLTPERKQEHALLKKAKLLELRELYKELLYKKV